MNYIRGGSEKRKQPVMSKIKQGLEAFYREVELTNNPSFLKAIKTGFLEGINNISKVFK